MERSANSNVSTLSKQNLVLQTPEYIELKSDNMHLSNSSILSKHGSYIQTNTPLVLKQQQNMVNSAKPVREDLPYIPGDIFPNYLSKVAAAEFNNFNDNNGSKITANDLNHRAGGVNSPKNLVIRPEINNQNTVVNDPQQQIVSTNIPTQQIIFIDSKTGLPIDSKLGLSFDPKYGLQLAPKSETQIEPKMGISVDNKSVLQSNEYTILPSSSLIRNSNGGPMVLGGENNGVIMQGGGNVVMQGGYMVLQGGNVVMQGNDNMAMQTSANNLIVQEATSGGLVMQGAGGRSIVMQAPTSSGVSDSNVGNRKISNQEAKITTKGGVPYIICNY